MNLLQKASKASGTHQFDLVLDAVSTEVPYELQQFVKAADVMKFIRVSGVVPTFVSTHCYKVIRESQQPALPL